MVWFGWIFMNYHDFVIRSCLKSGICVAEYSWVAMILLEDLVSKVVHVWPNIHELPWFCYKILSQKWYMCGWIFMSCHDFVISSCLKSGICVAEYSWVAMILLKDLVSKVVYVWLNIHELPWFCCKILSQKWYMCGWIFLSCHDFVIRSWLKSGICVAEYSRVARLLL